MKKQLTRMLMVAALAIGVMFEMGAVPAHPRAVAVSQPDGSTLMVKTIGDEYFHYKATTDGYTVVKNEQGGYEYAVERDGKLEPSGLLAHDAEGRSVSEAQFLQTIGQYLRSSQDLEQGRLRRAQFREQIQQSPAINYSKFRGLIVLINFNDHKFSMDNPNGFYDQMVNSSGYEGYDFDGYFWPCTGSVRDYYYDNSLGKFNPHFDIVGPVDVDYSALDASEKGSEIFIAALDAIDPMVDFSQYDVNNDNIIDMVYFLVAGYGSNYGNDSGYLWPHASALVGYSGGGYYYLTYDNKRMWSYASSIELAGMEGEDYTIFEGIGTICHEFSHVLGLPDLYDTDGSGSGGESRDPGDWDVMAQGCYNNISRTPSGYSSYEQYSLGWSNPREIDEFDEYRLPYVGTTGRAYILRSPVNKEYFMLENRQLIKWDSYLPGHGMVVWRVDSTNVLAWQNNRVNANPNHNYLEMVRPAGLWASSSDAFPGRKKIKWLSSYSTPNLKTWSGELLGLSVWGIQEDEGVITFTLLEGDCINGDVNEDGEIGIADVNTLVDMILDEDTWILADVNFDGEVGIADLNQLISMILDGQ